MLPIFFFPSEYISITASKYIIAFYVFVPISLFYAIKVFTQKSIRIPRIPFVWILLLMPFVYTIGSLASHSFTQSFFGSFYDSGSVLSSIVVTLVCVLTYVIVRTRKDLFIAHISLLSSFIILFLVQVIRIFISSNFLSFNILTELNSTPLGSWYGLGFFALVIGYLSVIGLDLFRRNLFFIGLFLFSVLGSLFLLSIVNFELLWIILAVSLGLFIVYVFLFLRKSEYRYKSLRPIFSIIIFIIVLIMILLSHLPTSGTEVYSGQIPKKLAIAHIEIRPSWNSTLDVATYSFAKSLLFGSGPNTFIEVWPVARAANVLSGDFWNVHFKHGVGTIPTAIATGGLIMSLYWICFFIGLLYLISFSIRLNAQNSFMYFMRITSLSAGSMLWISAIFYNIPFVLLLFASVYIGLLVASCSIDETCVYTTIEFKEGRMYHVTLFLCIFFVLSMLSIGSIYTRGNISSYLYKKSVNVAQTDIVSGIAMLTEANAWYVSDVYDKVLTDMYIAEMAEIIRNEDLADESVALRFQEHLDAAIASARHATEIRPQNYENWLALGKVYEAIMPLEVDGAFAHALDAYNTALSTNPKSPQVPFVLARLSFSEEDMNSARDWAYKALALKPNYSEAIFLVSQIAVVEGNLDEAIKAAQATVNLNPNDPTAYFQLGLLLHNTRSYDDAKSVFMRALELNPQYANAQYFLARTYYLLKDEAEAIRQFELLHDTYPDNEIVSRILENVSEGVPLFTGVDDGIDSVPDTLPLTE